VLTSIVPLLVFALAYQYKQFRNDVDNTGHQNLALARGLAFLVENQLQADIDALGVLAGSDSLRSGEFEHFRSQADAVIREQFPGATILVIGRDGRQLLNTNVPAGAKLPPSTEPEPAPSKQVFASGRPEVSNLFQEGQSNHFVVAIDVPVFGNDGRVAYVLSMNPDLQDFSRVLRQQKPPANWIASVFDADGTIVARIPNGERLVGMQPTPNFHDKLIKLPEGITDNISLDGIPLLSAFSHSEEFGWAVGIGVPRTDMTRPALQAAIDTLVAGSGFLIIGLGLALYAARHIARPIESLRRLAFAAHGPLPALTGLPEVDDVADALHAAEEARRRSQDAEAILRDAIETMPEGLAVYDDQDRLVICNDSYRHLFPNKPEDVLIGARFEDMLRAGVAGGYHAGPSGANGEWIADRVHDHQQPGAPVEERLADGRWILVSHHRLPNGWLADLRVDITDRKETEHQLVQAQKMEAIGNLTGGMAHDFNNLLGIIIGNLDLARGQVEGEIEELVSDAHEAAWRGADLTRRLLAFARRQPLHPEPIKVNDLIANTVRLLRPLLGETIEISLQLADGLWPATADPAQLESSLANLATNARDAMPKGGRLIISTANRQLDADYAGSHVDVTEGDYVMIEVGDTGCGMSPTTVERIFEPFFTTKDRGKGTGLGLSMVFGFLRQSGGHINVYSELGAGTTFRLYLPRAAGSALTVEDKPVTALAQGAGEIILVVEDNPEVRRVVMRQLSGLGYRAIETGSGPEALEVLAREPVDLLLTDIMMPGGLDGVDLAKIAIEKWPTLKVVLTSGFPEARIDIESEMLRSLRLLSKPYSRVELATVLRSSLDS
jgi:signal transduction histidine kinase